MTKPIVPMPLAEMKERLKYAGRSSTCSFEPVEAAAMHLTVEYLDTTLADERAERERLQAQLTRAQRDYEALDAKYQRATKRASKPSKRRAA